MKKREKTKYFVHSMYFKAEDDGNCKMNQEKNVFTEETACSTCKNIIKFLLSTLTRKTRCTHHFIKLMNV